MASYVFYIDDSGTKEYAYGSKEYSNSGNTRYFCFGGLLIQNEIGAQLSFAIACEKFEFFGQHDVEIKSNWLRIPNERSKRYLIPYGKSEDELKNFVKAIYGLINDTDLMLVAVVVDKVHMQEDYGENAFYTPAIAYEVLLQRIVQEIILPDTVSIILDDMDGATPKRNQYKDNLKKQHLILRTRGSRLQSGLDWGALKGIRFTNSARSHQIQIADIVAYNVYRQFSQHGESWENTAQDKLPTYVWLEKVLKKFRNKNGRVQGYGIIKLPMRQRVPWGVKN